MRLLGLVMVALCLGAWVAPTRAHRILFDGQVAVDPRDPARWLLSYSGGGGGLVRSTDDGRSGQLLCSDAMFSGTSQHPGPDEIRWLENGEVLVGSVQGLWLDDGSGCDWRREPAFAMDWVRELTPHPHEPNVVFAAALQMDGGPDRLVRRNGDGSRETLFELDEGSIVSVQVVARGPDAVRIYLLTGRGDPAAANADAGGPAARFAIRRSDDLGQSWQTYDLGLREPAGRLVAVDPTDPDRVLMVEPHDTAMPDAPDRLRVSRDGGASFEPWLELGRLGAVAVAGDGRVWVGDAGSDFDLSAPRGLYEAASLGSRPERIDGELNVECLHHIDATDQLLVCEPYDAGIFDPATGTYEPRLEMDALDDVVQCEGKDVCATCYDTLFVGYCSSVFYPAAPVCQQCGICELVLEPDDPYLPAADAGAGTVGRDAGPFDAGGASAEPDGATPTSRVQGRPRQDLRRRGHGGLCAARPPGAGHGRGDAVLLTASLLSCVVVRRGAGRRRRRSAPAQ